jgi:histidinol-phosphate aminotransferase
MPISRRNLLRRIGAAATVAAGVPSLTEASLSAALDSGSAAAGAGVAGGLIRLNRNENARGPSAKVIATMLEAAQTAANRYPDVESDALRNRIARFHSLPPDRVVLGCGSGEILRMAADAFVGSRKTLVVAQPTFELIGVCAQRAGADIVAVPLSKDFSHDLPAMLARSDAATGLVYICNPNNPTGSITPKQSVRSFLDAIPSSTMVLIDEAYHHYTESVAYETAIPLVAIRPNLIVSRTFSKIYGMAGLRVGYAIAQADVIRKLQQQAAWDSVNVIGLAAARASLSDSKHVADGKRRNSETKRDLVASLSKLGYSTIPSDTNFIMIDTRRDVKPLITALRGRGVQVGRLFPAMPHHLRVTIGTPQQMRQFLEAFRSTVAA